MSTAFAKVYRRVYEACCGRHPDLRPWHFQWLATRFVYRRFQEILPTLRGRILDVGCGAKPYRACFTGATEYTGLDITASPAVDVVVEPDERWPLPDEHFDVLLSSQVLQFVPDLDLTLGEMNRVLKRGGTMVLTFPFIYNEHRAPLDLRRFTAYGAATMLSGYDLRIERQGGIGSTLSILALNWIELRLNRSRPARIIKGVVLPLWVILSLAVNLAGLLADQIDSTGAFYSNVLVIARKP